MQCLFRKLAAAALISTWARCTFGQANEIGELDGKFGRPAATRSRLDVADQDSDQSVLLQHGSASLTLVEPRTMESELWLDTNNRQNSWAQGDIDPAKLPFGDILQHVFGAKDAPKAGKNASKYIHELRDQMQMKQNDEGDLRAFLSSLLANICMLMGMVFSFSILAMLYPMVYADNTRTGNASAIPSGFFGWVVASYRLHFEDIEKSAGLDAALFIEFVWLALRVTTLIAVPFVLVLCPLHYWCGGKAIVDNDNLSKIGMSNIADGSWVFWVHAALVWYVVLMVQSAVHGSQDFFVKKRFSWLSTMPHPRATTVLCEGIPPQYCTDEKLKAYFCKLFSEEQVDTAYVIKYTQRLESQVQVYLSAEDSLAAAKIEWEQAGGAQEHRPTVRDYTAKLVDKLDYYTNIKRDAGKKILVERQRIEKGEDVVYTNTGFVTFKRRRDAAVALYLKVEADDDIFAMSTPPDPADVIYTDFMIAGSWLALKETLGYISCVALFFAFTPIILGISSLINEEVILKAFPVLKKLFLKFPVVESFVSGLLASASLTLVMSFLPSLFVLIFTTFFQLKAGQWVQAKLQQWYFWFQVLFILLIPAVGASLLDTIFTIIDHPMSIVIMLAYRLPTCTHFYMNFIVMQWFTHGLNLTRYMNLIKFKTFSAVFSAERAKELSEPEDQDYYGIGSRSARFTINLCIGIVFGTMSPPINLWTFINFAICRLIYGYLIPFAETRKPDLGGVIWVHQLKHVFAGNMIYCLVMAGVLFGRTSSKGPGIIALTSLLYVTWSYNRFCTRFSWERLTIEEVVSKTRTSKVVNEGTYEQPEFVDS
mmetsp:Transcript_67079/g.127736  ORF Transcript_67079/g.127736 Transcript_67079/m.127736 type:complete len:821 (-) Transcript_67079:44-2506(-)